MCFENNWYISRHQWTQSSVLFIPSFQPDVSLVINKLNALPPSSHIFSLIYLPSSVNAMTCTLHHKLSVSSIARHLKALPPFPTSFQSDLSIVINELKALPPSSQAFSLIYLSSSMNSVPCPLPHKHSAWSIYRHQWTQSRAPFLTSIQSHLSPVINELKALPPSSQTFSLIYLPSSMNSKPSPLPHKHSVSSISRHQRACAISSFCSLCSESTCLSVCCYALACERHNGGHFSAFGAEY